MNLKVSWVLLFTLCAHARAGVMGLGLVSIIYTVYIYTDIYVYDPPKSLNGTLAVDLPFQTLAVDFSMNLKTSSTIVHSRNAFLIE